MVSENNDEIDKNLELTSHPHMMTVDTEIRISKDQLSVFELLRREKRGGMLLTPDYQRKDVWKNKKKSELIESILIGIPIPVIYLFEDTNGVKQIVDGKQRITALKTFINNEFALTNLGMLGDLNKKYFKDISPLLQAKLEDYQLQFYVIQPPTPEYVKFNIFERVNRGGVNLNQQEMRNALYQGKATELLNEIASSKEFQDCVVKDLKNNRMKDKYLILRFISFYLWFTGRINKDYPSTIDSFLSSIMKFINTNASEELIRELKNVTLLGVTNAYTILQNNAFKFKHIPGKAKRPINMLLFETIIFACCDLYIEKINLKSAKIILDEYKNEIESGGFISSSMDRLNNVEKRFSMAKAISKELKKCLNN